jgi:Zn-dependent M28 family amino/carboxypeptidase
MSVTKSNFAIDAATLKHHVEAISFERCPHTHPQERKRAFAYVHDHFKSYGLETEVDPFDVGPDRFFNILGLRNAVSPTDAWIVLAAHVDTVPGTPGADDNASGVAALLECARVLSKEKLNFSICFAATDLEEYGIEGARHLADRFLQEGKDVRAMLSLEMLGYTSDETHSQRYPALLRPFYPSEANFIALVGNRRSKKLLKSAARCFRQVRSLPVETLTAPLDGRLIPATRLSDHSPFGDRGIPALMVTDTAFFRNPHYHLPSDTPDTLDWDFLARVTEASAVTLGALAGVRDL